MSRLGVALLFGLPAAAFLLSRASDASPKPPPKPNPNPWPPDNGPATWPPGDTLPKDGTYPFIETLPELKQGEPVQVAAKKLITRGNMIRDEIARLIDSGELSTDNLDWTSVFTSSGQYSAEVPVMRDALKIDGVRVTVSHRTAQQIADLLGIYLLTTKVSDAIRQAAGLSVSPNAHEEWMKDGTGSYTARMVAHSLGVDAELEKAEPFSHGGYNESLVDNAGKLWILSKKNWDGHLTWGGKSFPGIPATNYGWYSDSAPNAASSLGLKLWQQAATAHDIDHVDYSQTFRAMGPAIHVRDGDGDPFEVPMREALTNPKWAPLVSLEGAFAQAHHPSIPFYSVAA